MICKIDCECDGEGVCRNKITSPQLESINNYTNNNESIKNSEKSILSQPEEWESRFDKKFSEFYTESITHKRFESDEIKDFIKTEIRKAEEKGYAEGTDKGYFQGREDGRLEGYNQAITDAVEALPKVKDDTESYYSYEDGLKLGHNEAVNQARASLEALKK